jgi:hypothetical protein
MQLERVYTLPNCTLTLEGMSDGSSNDGLQSNKLSILLNAFCHILGQERALVGGKDFLNQLANAVSHYAQEFLSGVRSRYVISTGMVQLQSVAGELHRLRVFPEGNAATADPLEVDLTTVQLFDLLEAVDQLLADPMTLPDMALELKPRTRQEVMTTSEPLLQRAATPAIGITGLALAAAALFQLPVPNVTKSPELANKPADSAQVDPTKAATALNGAPLITDPAQVSEIQEKVRTAIDGGWTATPTFTEPLAYRVSAGADGQILGYREETPIAANFSKELPLADLLYKPAEGTANNKEPLADFRVTFTPDGKGSGQLQVEPWQATPSPLTTSPTSAASPSISPDAVAPTPEAPTPEAASSSTATSSAATSSPATSSPAIPNAASPVPSLIDPSASPVATPEAAATPGDPSAIGSPGTVSDREALIPVLYDQVDKGWTQNPTFTEPVIFKVQMTADGKITNVEGQGAVANAALAELPLNGLKQTGVTGPVGDFKVVFKPSGALEINPW